MGELVDLMSTDEPSEAGLAQDVIDFFIRRMKGKIVIPKEALLSHFLYSCQNLASLPLRRLEDEETWKSMRRDLAAAIPSMIDSAAAAEPAHEVPASLLLWPLLIPHEGTKRWD